MSSNKSPGNTRRNDGSKQGNEQNSEKQGSAQMDQGTQEPGGQRPQEDLDLGNQGGRERNGSDSGGGKS